MIGSGHVEYLHPSQPSGAVLSPLKAQEALIAGLHVVFDRILRSVAERALAGKKDSEMPNPKRGRCLDAGSTGQVVHHSPFTLELLYDQSLPLQAGMILYLFIISSSSVIKDGDLLSPEPKMQI